MLHRSADWPERVRLVNKLDKLAEELVSDKEVKEELDGEKYKNLWESHSVIVSKLHGHRFKLTLLLTREEPTDDIKS